jgi:hypothetical protein
MSFAVECFGQPTVNLNGFAGSGTSLAPVTQFDPSEIRFAKPLCVFYAFSISAPSVATLALGSWGLHNNLYNPFWPEGDPCSFLEQLGRISQTRNAERLAGFSFFGDFLRQVNLDQRFIRNIFFVGQHFKFLKYLPRQPERDGFHRQAII